VRCQSAQSTHTLYPPRNVVHERRYVIRIHKNRSQARSVFIMMEWVNVHNTTRPHLQLLEPFKDESEPSVFWFDVEIHKNKSTHYSGEEAPDGDEGSCKKDIGDHDGHKAENAKPGKESIGRDEERTNGCEYISDDPSDRVGNRHIVDNMQINDTYCKTVDQNRGKKKHGHKDS